MMLRQFLHSVYLPSRLGLSPGTVTQIEITIRLFERWAAHPVDVSELSEPFLRAFLADYFPRVSGSTCNAKRRQLLALWRCGWEEGLLPGPPRARKVPKARESLRLPEAWSAEQFGQLLWAAKTARGQIAGISARYWWESLLLAAYDTGERRAALLRTAPANLSLDGGWLIFPTTKQGIPRICPLHASTLDACRRIWEPCRPLLWPWPFSRELLDRRFRRLCLDAGIPHGRASGGLFHKIRRTTATLTEANGGDGAEAIGDSRKVFERHYRDPRFFQGQLGRLPRPKF